jgi:ABC-type multidrug transport system fused ATPase/permease subunit
MKIVVAFGQQTNEEENFTRFLEKNVKERVMNIAKGIIGLGIFTIIIYGAYAYGLFMGAYIIHNQWTNGTDKKGQVIYYVAGDVISIFFGIIFGGFALGFSAPYIKTVTDGRVNCALALETINRKPSIVLNDSNMPVFNSSQKGDIIFKNVSFKYPSRLDPALNSVNFKIAQGKTTAIVGASGSGKSTVVKLLERYYDPTEGTIEVQGQCLKDINLQSY